jgi:hypothetical protein
VGLFHVAGTIEVAGTSRATAREKSRLVQYDREPLWVKTKSQFLPDLPQCAHRISLDPLQHGWIGYQELVYISDYGESGFAFGIGRRLEG